MLYLSPLEGKQKAWKSPIERSVVNKPVVVLTGGAPGLLHIPDDSSTFLTTGLLVDTWALKIPRYDAVV